MTDTPAPTASLLLYSQVSHDERGNFRYQGDLYRQAEPFPDLADRIRAHLAAHFPDTAFSVITEKFAGGRKIIAEILDASQDLSTRDAQEAMITAVRDQMERFGFTNSNIYQDFHSCSYFTEVRVGRAYWSALARRRGADNHVEPLVSLAHFKKSLKVGQQLKLVAAPKGHRALGTTRTITAVRSKDIILDGVSYLTLPRAADFACDGARVRIAMGSEHEPDAHLLYEWLLSQAA